MEPASTHLEAALVERPRRLRYWLGVLVSLLTQEAPPLFDLVVTRRGSGAEVLRTTADLGDPAALLETVRADLDSKTVEEFVREWRVVE